MLFENQAQTYKSNPGIYTCQPLEERLLLICAVSNNAKKLDRGLCLSRTNNAADYDSRGFQPATPVAGPATLRY